MTEYFSPETTVYRGCCHVIKIEAKFIRGTAVSARDTGARLGTWVQHFCASHAITRERRKTDQVRSGHTQRSPVVQGACRSIHRTRSKHASLWCVFHALAKPVRRSRDSTHAVPHARIPVASPQLSPTRLTYRRAIRSYGRHRDNAGWNCMRHTVAKFSKEVSKEKCTCCTYHVRGPRLYSGSGFPLQKPNNTPLSITVAMEKTQAEAL